MQPLLPWQTGVPIAPLVPSRAGVRHTDPDTSHTAAQQTPRRERDRDRVLRVLQQHPAGLTDFELARLLGGQQTSLGKRRGELRAVGLVEDSGERRPSPSGSPAIVWRVR